MGDADAGSKIQGQFRDNMGSVGQKDCAQGTLVSRTTFLYSEAPGHVLVLWEDETLRNRVYGRSLMKGGHLHAGAGEKAPCVRAMARAHRGP